jgi:hypothetical protein
LQSHHRASDLPGPLPPLLAWLTIFLGNQLSQMVCGVKYMGFIDKVTEHTCEVPED